MQCAKDGAAELAQQKAAVMQRTLATKCESGAKKSVCILRLGHVRKASCGVGPEEQYMCVCAQFSGIAHKNVFQLFCEIASLIMEMINRQVQ